MRSIEEAHGRLGRALSVIGEDFTSKSARFLEAGLDLAGLDDLVGIVRPGVGRRGRPLGKTQLDATAPRAILPAADKPKALPSSSADEPKTLPAPAAVESVESEGL